MTSANPDFNSFSDNAYKWFSNGYLIKILVSQNYTTGNDESCKVFNMSKLTKQWNKDKNIENTYIYLRYNDISSNTRKT